MDGVRVTDEVQCGVVAAQRRACPPRNTTAEASKNMFSSSEIRFAIGASQYQEGGEAGV